MAQQEHVLGCDYSVGGIGGSGGDGGVSSSGPGGKSSKKVKQKKVPQRGLGVAQLEKIRLEEQQKMDSLEALNNVVLGMNNSIELHSPQFVSVNSPKFRSLYNSTPNLQNALYRQAQGPSSAVPTVIRSENPVQIAHGHASLGHATWPRLWNGEYSLVVGEIQQQTLDHNGFGPCEVVQPSPAYEFNSPSVLMTTPIASKRPPQQFMVNTSPGISRSSVVQRSQVEPPSNQKSCSTWSEEDKVVGVKRPYPFTLESHRNVCSTDVVPVSRSDEITSSINGHGDRVEQSSKSIREDPSGLTGLPKGYPCEVTRQDEKLTQDFLTLAPPAFACPPLDAKHKHPLDYPCKQGHRLPELEFVLSQEQVKNQNYEAGPSGSTKQSFRFFLTTKYPSDQTASCVSNRDGEKGEETLDLNLKL